MRKWLTDLWMEHGEHEVVKTVHSDPSRNIGRDPMANKPITANIISERVKITLLGIAIYRYRMTLFINEAWANLTSADEQRLPRKYYQWYDREYELSNVIKEMVSSIMGRLHAFRGKTEK